MVNLPHSDWVHSFLVTSQALRCCCVVLVNNLSECYPHPPTLIVCAACRLQPSVPRYSTPHCLHYSVTSAPLRFTKKCVGTSKETRVMRLVSNGQPQQSTSLGSSQKNSQPLVNDYAHSNLLVEVHKIPQATPTSCHFCRTPPATEVFLVDFQNI